MKNVTFDPPAAESVWTYFDNYQRDMPQRAFHISRIRSCLAYIEAYFEDVYTFDGKNFIDIDNICRVEFSIESNYSGIIVKNIYFK